MIQQTSKWVFCALLPVIFAVGCRTSSNSRTAERSPSVAKPQEAQYSGSVYDSVLSRSTRYNTSVVIDIAAQTAYLLVDGQIAVQSPVSTARPGKYTPRGTFYMSERVRSGKISTIYNVAMPYWMRLNSSPFGLHAGHCPGYPASAGCIRMPSDMARMVYDHTRSGTKVSIQSSWSG